MYSEVVMRRAAAVRRLPAVLLDAQIQDVTVFSETELSVAQSAHLDRMI